MTSASRPAVHPASATVGRNVVTIASGKGGVGKTWLAITLTHALARLGKRALLFDGDLGLANVDIQLGLDVRQDLGAVVGGRAALKDAVTRFADGGFDIVAGKSGSGALAELGLGRLKELRQELWMLAAGYDRVVLDLGAGVESTVRALTPRGGIVLVVATDEPTSLTDAYAFIKMTSHDNAGADIRIVVNMAESKRHGERTHAALLNACRNFLQIAPPLAGVIRRDNKVREAIRHQTALFTRHPTSDAAADIEALARVLLEG